MRKPHAHLMGMSGFRGMARHGLAACLALLMLGTRPASAQEDTTAVEEPSFLDDHSPRGALKRAAILPGWGQIYNHQYWKLPVVYGGLAGLIYVALSLNQEYLLYRHAALYGDYAGEENPPEEFCECYRDDLIAAIRDVGLQPAASEEELRAQGREFASAFRDRRDIFRRNRDLSYFGIGLFYGLTVLDAYVSAHLLHFDVSEDLTLALEPVPHGVAARVRWRP